MKTTGIFATILILASTVAAGAQAVPAAKRHADVQAGVDFSIATPDYTSNIYNLAQPTGINSWHGYGAYADIDFRNHYGVEFDFHNLYGSDSVLYERSFEVGLRYLYPIKDRFIPYGKVMEGRGIFNFAAQNSAGQSYAIANLAYNTQSFGGGLDLRLTKGLNIRVIDYEYQHWDNFPPKSLNPQVLSFGIAYHFHGSILRGH